ncbi:hypothetical protein QYE76_065189 [Lolium multiflorum]|uniref:RNase H type-1 domain-containing protein n=1 Tax=Lolium multiflorum TaxID=4521 RepID=A0AAD8S8C4_LOLMU|nr:hypothetical protein QYE76_065189 [Lolium multiflorum]
MRKYIQRWNIIKNSAEDISDERAIDAFVAGVRRADFIEDLGRTNPKTISALMEIANKWADGEDAIYNKRHRSPEEDRGRNYQNRRRFSRQFYNNDAPGHISAGFRGNPGGNSRDDYQRSNEQQGDNRGDFRGNRQNSGPRIQRPYVSPEEMMNGPCQMHFYLDNNGKRQSGHLQKDCRNFQAMLRAAGIANAQANNRNPREPRSEIHLPPPPAITDENRHQLRIAAAPHPPPYVDPNSNGAVSMIQKRPSNRAQKVISRQVFMAEKMPPPTVEYLNWSGQDIGFTIADHPQQVPRPGQSALILPAVIAGFDVSRVFIDGGSSLNLMCADTLRKMNISLANLKPTDTRFHGITPEKPSYPLGKINLDVQFGTRENYRIENLEFEVVDFRRNITLCWDDQRMPEWMELQNTGPPDLSRTWTMNFDGSKRLEGAGAGVILVSPEGDKLKYVLRMTFPNASNNDAEYEALIHGMKMAKACGATRLKIFGDSQLVAQQVMNQCDAVNESMIAYKEVYNELEKLFDGCEVNHISRMSNDEADVLANIGSQCLAIPPGVFGKR